MVKQSPQVVRLKKNTPDNCRLLRCERDVEAPPWATKKCIGCHGNKFSEDSKRRGGR